MFFKKTELAEGRDRPLQLISLEIIFDLYI